MKNYLFVFILSIILSIVSLSTNSFALHKKYKDKVSSVTVQHEYNNVWDITIKYLESKEGPGILKQDKITGNIITRDILEKRRSFFDLTNRRRSYFELHINDLGQDGTQINVCAILLEDVDFNKWEPRTDPKTKDMFEEKLMSEILLRL
jgi:hypothetical protein